jgi:hypothetical protein
MSASPRRQLRTYWNYIKTSKLHDYYEKLVPNFIKNSYRSVPLLFPWLQWRYSKNGYRQAREILEPMRGKYKGCRAIIIGNGPSLRNTNLGLLKDEYTFGLNRIYLLFDELGFDTTFYVCVKDLVLEQFKEEIEPLNSLKFIDWKIGHKLLKDQSRTVFVPRVSSDVFQKDILKGWDNGFTVTFVAMQIAYYLGFSQVILIGVDHSFSTKGPNTREVVSEGEDPNHFSPVYFGKGVRWALPNMEGMETMYRRAGDAFEKDGRVMLDATVGGKLTVFPKVTLEEILAQDNYKNKLS